MHIVVTGGGSGGHVTPIKFVVETLKKKHPRSHVTYIGHRGDSFVSVMEDSQVDDIRLIRAGKWRRDTRKSKFGNVLSLDFLRNLVDLFNILIGFLQSIAIMRSGPDTLFVRGGYVGVPVGMAARLFGVPIITHDSDTIPSWANKIVGRWATVNAVASDEGEYGYNPNKLRAVGVPIDPAFFEAETKNQIEKARKLLGVGQGPVILVMGGSLGAKTINDAMVAISDNLMAEDIEVLHLTGSEHERSVKDSLIGRNINFKKYHIYGYMLDAKVMMAMYRVADVIVSRAGATSVAGIAAAHKPAIIIPGSQLADQVSNSLILKKKKSAIVLTDEIITNNPELLYDSIKKLITDKKLAQLMADNFSKSAGQNASEAIVGIIEEITEQN